MANLVTNMDENEIKLVIENKKFQTQMIKMKQFQMLRVKIII